MSGRLPRRIVVLAGALATAALLGVPAASAVPPVDRGSRASTLAAEDPVLVGAGDIADCHRSADARTADLIDGIAGRVFAAGDLAYPSGTARQFRDCYGPTWGRFRSRTSPAIGNHEYETAGARPYFDEFGAAAGARGKGWYAFDLGTWRIYVLNSNCGIVRCGRASAQGRWLRADLAANPRACVAAIWHHPLFSSGEHGDSVRSRRLWRPLAAAGADVVLNGHDHDYERFAPQTIDGDQSPDGMREFVVGTGGAPLRRFGHVAANSVARSAAAHGVLKLTLRSGGYAWTFVPVAGKTYADSGAAACH